MFIGAIEEREYGLRPKDFGCVSIPGAMPQATLRMAFGHKYNELFPANIDDCSAKRRAMIVGVLQKAQLQTESQITRVVPLQMPMPAMRTDQCSTPQRTERAPS
jgi:hypothetical protein